MRDNTVLAPIILEALGDTKVCGLVEHTLAEDLKTFGVPKALELACLTLDRLRKAGANYSSAARDLALSVYPEWDGGPVKDKYHAYNWSVERRGSASLAASHIHGGRIWDLGGGPGTFALELLKVLEDQQSEITITDLADYRVSAAKAHPRIHLRVVDDANPFPLAPKSVGFATILYCLHHLVSMDRTEALHRIGQICTKGIVIFEDVLVDTSRSVQANVLGPQRALWADFILLTLGEQHRFIALVDYICNHIASQARSMPMPCAYWEFHEFESLLRKVFPKANVTARLHGIYKTKCYPNPEAMYVVTF